MRVERKGRQHPSGSARALRPAQLTDDRRRPGRVSVRQGKVDTASAIERSRGVQGWHFLPAPPIRGAAKVQGEKPAALMDLQHLEDVIGRREEHPGPSVRISACSTLTVCAMLAMRTRSAWLLKMLRESPATSASRSVFCW